MASMPAPTVECLDSIGTPPGLTAPAKPPGLTAPPGLAAPAKPPGTFLPSHPPGVLKAPPGVFKAAPESNSNCTAAAYGNKENMFNEKIGLERLKLENMLNLVLGQPAAPNVSCAGHVSEPAHFEKVSCQQGPDLEMATCKSQEGKQWFTRRDVSLELSSHTTQQGALLVRWPIDAQKLRTKDRQIVSPTFEIAPGIKCRMMLKPRATGDRKGQASFQKAKGWGIIEIKLAESCPNAPEDLRCRLSVGEQQPRGPVELNFSASSVCGLPKGEEEWDLKAGSVGAGPDAGATCVITMEVLPTNFDEESVARAPSRPLSAGSCAAEAA